MPVCFESWSAERARLLFSTHRRLFLLGGVAVALVGTTAAFSEVRGLILLGLDGWGRNEVVVQAPPPRLSFGHFEPLRPLSRADYQTALDVAAVPALLDQGLRFHAPRTGRPVNSDPVAMASAASIPPWPSLDRPQVASPPPSATTQALARQVIRVPGPAAPAQPAVAMQPDGRPPLPDEAPRTATSRPIVPAAALPTPRAPVGAQPADDSLQAIRRELADVLRRPSAPAPVPRGAAAPPRALAAPAPVAAAPAPTQVVETPARAAGDPLARARLSVLPPPPAVRFEESRRALGQSRD